MSNGLKQLFSPLFDDGDWVRDLDLAAWLSARPISIRELIEQNRRTMESHGGIESVWQWVLFPSLLRPQTSTITEIIFHCEVTYLAERGASARGLYAVGRDFRANATRSRHPDDRGEDSGSRNARSVCGHRPRQSASDRVR